MVDTTFGATPRLGGGQPLLRLNGLAADFARETVPLFIRFATQVAEQAEDDPRDVADLLAAFAPLNQAMHDFLQLLEELSPRWTKEAADFSRFLSDHPELELLASATAAAGEPGRPLTDDRLWRRSSVPSPTGRGTRRCVGE